MAAAVVHKFEGLAGCRDRIERAALAILFEILDSVDQVGESTERGTHQRQLLAVRRRTGQIGRGSEDGSSRNGGRSGDLVEFITRPDLPLDFALPAEPGQEITGADCLRQLAIDHRLIGEPGRQRSGGLGRQR